MKQFGYSMTCLMVGVILFAGTAMAGDLDSTGAPNAVNYYTLEHLYNRLDAGTAGAQQTFTEPVAGPTTPTMHTINQIMAKAPALDNANGAIPADVATGKTFWGLNAGAGQWGLKTGTGSGRPAPVPKTGQTTSYATGDDGDLEKGVAYPNPRFTYNGNGTVTDNLTGLIWLKDANCFGSQSWATALTDCGGLASGSCGLTDGSTAGDWRLPNVKELQSLIHFGYYNPALCNTAGTGLWSAGDPFNNVQSGDYWSSTTTPNFTTYAVAVVFSAGATTVYDKTTTRYVWPVRGPQ